MIFFKKSLLFFLSVIFIGVCPVSGSQLSEGTTIGIMSGYTYGTADFRDNLSGGYTAGASLIYPLSMLSRYMAIDSGINMLRFNLDNSSHSALTVVSFRSGCMFFYPIMKYFQPFSSILFQGSYYNLLTNNTDRNENEFRPGGVFKTGIFSYYKYGIGSMIGIEYALNPLSGRIFSPFALTFAITYNFKSSELDQKNFTRIHYINKTDSLCIYGVELFRKKRLEEAEETFRSILKYDNDHEKAAEYLGKINRLKIIFRKAKKLVNAGENFRALPYLVESADYLEKADAELTKLRRMYRKNIPAWEKMAVCKFRVKKYEGCIVLMKRILLIDPDNQTATVYLSKAETRKQALKKLN